MKVKDRSSVSQQKKSSGKKAVYIITAIVLIIAIAVVIAAVILQRIDNHNTAILADTQLPDEKDMPSAVVDPVGKWPVGYIATLNTYAEVFDENGASVGKLLRGTSVKYSTDENGKTTVLTDGKKAFLSENAHIVASPEEAVPSHTLYVRTAVNLRTSDGKLTAHFADKGSEITVIGYDYLEEDGNVHAYLVKCGDNEGYIDPWYVVSDEETALSNYDDNGSYAIHADREDHYGGGFGANLDYFPREKASFENNVMPEECRTLYLVNWRLGEVDEYIELAKDSGINAFVVDITDGGSIGYASDVMNLYCPSAAAAAVNTVEDYKAAIQKIKDAGFYVIGRITTFNDSYFIEDHPECAILGSDGNPIKLSGEYWPSPYNRFAWQYKVDLAVEAVELMGFNEIQFDYVRFPDRTMSYEEAGTIEFNNTYGETKAQAIQRFLMYATDILHEKGVYVSADVYGESAYTYVTAYGQYWPAISNVVDVISGMPYPDHFGWTDTWRPWEHPYETLYEWGLCVMERQSETATPAVVRTWIQAYNAIREPYNTYGVEEVDAQIRGLRDSGCTGGYMTWNASSSLDKYTSLIPAFAEP